MSSAETPLQCPCQSGLTYAECCEPFHKGQPAPTAEKLMRSRYSAFVLTLPDYLMSTTHRSNSDYQKNAKLWRMSILNHCKKTNFQSLEILEHVPGETDSTVTFRAQLTLGGNPVTMTEKSRFLKLGQRWLYYSGEPEIVMAE